MRTILPKLSITLMIVILSIGGTFAQNLDECNLLIARAFAAVNENCEGLGPEAACYGYGEVQSTYFDGTTEQPQLTLEDLLALPADQVSLIDEELLTLESLETALLQLEEAGGEEIWGIVVQLVRANLPIESGESGVTFMLIGESRIENGVFPDEAVLIRDSVDVLVDSVQLFSAPPAYPVTERYDRRSIIVDTVSGERIFSVNGVTPDGQWARVYYEYETPFGIRTTAWIQTSFIPDEFDLSGLPILAPDAYTPMQWLYLTNEFNQGDCVNAPPDGMVVQSPNDIESDYHVNELPLRTTGTAFIELLPPGNTMRVTSLDGFTIAYFESEIEDPRDEAEVIIPAGYFADFCLTGLQDLGIDQQINDRAVVIPCDGKVAGLSRNLDLFDSFVGLAAPLFPVRVPDVVVGSGIGGVVEELVIYDDETRQRIIELCNDNRLPPSVCDTLQS